MARRRRPPAPPETVDPSSLVLVGAVMGAIGVRGELRLRAFTAAPENLVAYGPLYGPDGRLLLTPTAARPVKDGLAIRAAEVKTREQAQALRHTPLHVPRALLPEPDEEEFYHVDLIGCRVETPDGETLGEIIAVQNFGAGDLLQVRPAEGADVFLPFTRAVCPVVDLAGRRVVAVRGEEGA